MKAQSEEGGLIELRKHLPGLLLRHPDGDGVRIDEVVEVSEWVRGLRVGGDRRQRGP